MTETIRASAGALLLLGTLAISGMQIAHPPTATATRDVHLTAIQHPSWEPIDTQPGTYED